MCARVFKLDGPLAYIRREWPLTYVAEASVSRHDDLGAPHAGSRGEGSSRANEGEKGEDEAGHGV